MNVVMCLHILSLMPGSSFPSARLECPVLSPLPTTAVHPMYQLDMRPPQDDRQTHMLYFGDAKPTNDECPDIPGELSVEVLDPTSVILTWSAITTAVSYEVEVEDTENTPAFDLEETISASNLTVRGLVAGGTYKFKVKAKCASGSSDHSPWFFFGTTAGTGGEVDSTNCSQVPSDLVVSELSSTSVLLSWDVIGAATAYEVEVEDDDNTPPFSLEVNTPETSLEVDGLAAGGHYKFKVKARCPSGSSEHSPWHFFSAPGQTTSSNHVGGLSGQFVRLLVYPNPASSTLWLEADHHEIRGPLAIRITNPTGKQVFQTQLDGRQSNVEINVTQWPVGLYTIVSGTDRATAIDRIVVQR